MAEVLEIITGSEYGEKVVLGVGVADISTAMQKFGLCDYAVFATMLSICIVIGIYFAIIGRKCNTQEYLVGSRKMNAFPISLSLIASYISGISLLGIPTEIYVYGIQYIYIGFAIIIMAIIAQNIYLPVFHNLQITSTYEYLERRFDKRVRLFGSVLFIIGLIVWLPVVIYVPALAFNQVTGVNVHLITPAVCITCIFYTTIGGLKAVVWTDVVQTLIMVGAMILVIVKGTIDVGGFENVWKRNWNSDRIEMPNFDLNPLTRHTFWTLVVGGSFYLIQSCIVNQNMLQRYLALTNIKHVNRSLWLFVFGLFVFIGLGAYSGMVIYATFYKCDPLTTKLAREKDQLLPLLVMEVLGDYPGLPGLFIAGIFSAALSSLSTGLNSMAAVILEDFGGYCMKSHGEIAEKHKQIIMRMSVITFGVICVILVFIVERLGPVLQMTASISAISAGPCLSLFTMGMLLPWINGKAALTGGITGLGLMAWICLSAQASIASGDLLFAEKPVTTEGCHYTFTPKLSPALSLKLHPTTNNSDDLHTNEIFVLYRMSYLWYTLMGCLISIVVALIVTFLTKPLDPHDLDMDLFAPCVRKLIKPRKYPNQPSSDEIIFAYEKENDQCSISTAHNQLPNTNQV
ncbi:PREDICTED: sodium-coupled monocarboxylate transporter 1-like [Nicrophorus vespilloides]|uniref:Sodium-coupled monocarboxylate transporter 1-like n=1 Tax=Nicrophorus vespilloides TaxID=110193 RepID=A0ABM1MID2_NICVS|nr:PREDICTED: sodium-coupled monocarboxylate transporter 1-like [Nicrophorus vespilloides]XP_017774333.1 PREDICTED: sodium-coupled monocarboxylate transporter 1-like [Nicrophorus vespilloides]